MCKMTAHCTSKEQASKCLVSWQLLYSYKYGLEVLTAVQLVPEESKQRKKTSEEENREPIVRIATYMRLTRNQKAQLLRLRKSSLNCNSMPMYLPQGWILEMLGAVLSPTDKP